MRKAFILTFIIFLVNLNPIFVFSEDTQIERGRPIFFVDAIGNILSLPKKIALLNFKVDNHHISAETEAVISKYIKDNPQRMKGTKVRLNQFCPIADLKRLAKNKKISWYWRVFPGIPSTLFTSLTGRLFGGDNYNPYADTVNIYSDIPAVALHEAGHVIDIGKKMEEGWGDYYIVGRILPPVALYQEYEASQEAISYISAKKEQKDEENAYKVLIPAYGTYVGGCSGLPYGDVIGAGLGHVISITPRYNCRLKYQALSNAIWYDEIVYDIKSDSLAKSLIEEREKADSGFNKSFLKDNIVLADVFQEGQKGGYK